MRLLYDSDWFCAFHVGWKCGIARWVVLHPSWARILYIQLIVSTWCRKWFWLNLQFFFHIWESEFIISLLWFHPTRKLSTHLTFFSEELKHQFFFWQSLPDRMFESFKMMPLFALRITSKGGTDVWFTRLFQGKGSAMENQHPTIAWWQEIHTWKTKRWILYHIQTQNMFFSTFISSVCNVHVFAHHLCMMCLQCACVWTVLQRASYL